jgi:CubicO group peptidase (beta-lactamase class C family)
MSHDWSRFEAYVHKMMVEHLIPGAAVAVWQNGAIAYARGFGFRDRNLHLPVDPDTVFGIASVSKSFASMSIMQLVERGFISLDDPVVNYVPEFRPKGVAPGSVKVWNLLSHTAGLPPLAGINYANEAELPGTLTSPDGLMTHEAREAFLKHMNEDTYSVFGAPGEYFSYSNPCFVVASMLIETVTGMPFYEYVKKNVFLPCGMSRTTYRTGDLASMENVTSLYMTNPKGETVVVPTWPDPKVFGASGSIKSTANDLIKYAAVYAAAGMKGHERIISGSGVRKIRTPVYQLTRSAHYGLGVQVTPGYEGHTLVEHGGSNPGVSSTFGFVPEAGLAAIVLTNVQYVPAASIWLAAINTALDLPLEKQRYDEKVWAAPAGYMEQFAGTYKSMEGADLSIQKRAGGFTLRDRDDEFPLLPTGDDYAIYNARGQERLTRFFRKADGSILGMFSGNSMTGVRLVPKVD